MKKMLTTLMVLAFAFAATSAMAGDMNWSFYGKLHTSVNMMDDSKDSQLGLSSNTSRFGFKGDQELDENFTFIWQFENKVDIADGDGTLASRNSFLGLKSEWGTALWGIHDTPFKILGRKTTFFQDSIGDNRQVMLHTDDRNTGYLMYFSPDISGFGFQLGYEFDKNEIDAKDEATSIAGMLHYTMDEFFFGFAYESLTKGNENNYWELDNLPARDKTESRMRFGGMYDGEQFALAGSFQMLKDYEGIKNWKSMTIGGEALFHATEQFDLKGGFYILDPNTESINPEDPTDKVKQEDRGCNLLTLGIDFNYTKNVQFYLQYAAIMNQDKGSFGLGDYNGFGAATDVALDKDDDPLTDDDPFLGKTVSGICFGTTVKW